MSVKELANPATHSDHVVRSDFVDLAMQSLPDRIKRRAGNITARELSRMSGISDVAIGRWLGRRSRSSKAPSLEIAYRLAIALEISLDDLLNVEQPIEPFVPYNRRNEVDK